MLLQTKLKKTLTPLLTATVLLGLTASGATALTPEESNTIHVSIDTNKTQTIETTAETVEEALEENSITVEPGDEISPPLATAVADDLAVTVVTSKTIKLKVGNHPARQVDLPVLTVDEALKEAKVSLNSADRVSPGRTAVVKNNQTIVVKRVAYKTTAKNSKIKNKTRTVKTKRLYKGQRKIHKKGRPGVKRTYYKHTYVNGKRTMTKRIKTKITRKPVTRVIYVGTRPKPTLTGVWKSLAQCESGGNPRIVSSNGLYHGLFQFSVGTWRSVGGKGLPSRASVAEQLKRAKILQARSGWGQWPHCSSKIGLK